MSEIVENLSGSNGYVIGDVRPLYTDSSLVEIGSQEWLKTGVINDDVASYPDAKSVEHEGKNVVGIPTQLFFEGTDIPLYLRIK